MRDLEELRVTTENLQLQRTSAPASEASSGNDGEIKKTPPAAMHTISHLPAVDKIFMDL